MKISDFDALGPEWNQLDPMNSSSLPSTSAGHSFEEPMGVAQSSACQDMAGWTLCLQ